MNILFWISIVSFFSAIVSFTGIYTAYKNQTRIAVFKDHLLCFAAGVLITTPLLIAFPKSFAMNEKGGFFALLGFLLMWLVDKIFNRFVIDENSKTAYLGVFAIGFHSFVDGIVYSVSFSVSFTIGVLSSLGLIAHEIAEGVITYTFLTEAGLESKKALLYSFIIAGLTTPLGAFLTYPVMIIISKNILLLMIAIVGGILLYFSSTHLIPEVRESPEKHSHLSFILGLAFAVIMSFLD